MAENTRITPKKLRVDQKIAIESVKKPIIIKENKIITLKNIALTS